MLTKPFPPDSGVSLSSRPVRRLNPRVILVLALVVIAGVAIACYVVLSVAGADSPERQGAPGSAGLPRPCDTEHHSWCGRPSPTASGPRLPALKDVFHDQFLVGTAAGVPQLSGASADLLRQQFSSITPTTAMKWTSIEPQEGVFDFADADAIVGFAQKNHLRVRGHTLIWYRQTPDWVFQDANGDPMTPSTQSKALVLSRLEAHITAVMTRYRGKVYAWDVVNEVLADDGSMRDSRWYQFTGMDYLKDAFVVAHEVDPHAELCVNDYGLASPIRRDAMYRLVRDLIADGVPVTCIGSQLHGDIASPSAKAVAASIDLFAKLGVDQQITEMDVSVYTDDTSSYTVIPDSVLQKQARHYRELFAVFRSRQSKISSVTVWGISDADTWLDSTPIPRHDEPLLFDADLRPKPAFWAVVGHTPSS